MAEKTIFAELDPIFHPRSVALIGASGKKGKVGRLFTDRFLETKFQEFYPVNPGENEILGVKAYHSILDIPHPVDMAIVLTPTDAALAAVKECAAKHVKTIVITTSGFAESGKAGKVLQEEMVRIARQAGSRIIGPNCIGIYCPSSRLPYTLHQGEGPGSVGLVSQSGFFADYLTERATANGIDFSKAISCGNESDLTAADFLEYLGEDPETEIVVAYIEGSKDGRRFFEVCREVSKKKPIIMWKGGMTEAGARAAVSHTGAMAGSGAVWEGALRQAGIISVRSFEEMLDCLYAFRLQPLPKGKRVGIVSAPGGMAVATTDRCFALGLEVPQFSTQTLERLRKAMPPVGGSVNNPVDLSLASAVKPYVHGDAVRILADDEQIDMILLISIASGELLLDILETSMAGARIRKPLVVTVMAGSEQDIGGDFPLLLSNGISVYPDGARAAKVLSRLWEYAWFRTRSGAKNEGGRTEEERRPRPNGKSTETLRKARAEGRTNLSEHESKEVLQAYGIPVARERETHDEGEFRKAAAEIGFPLVIKGNGPNISHKTEHDLVHVDVRSEQEAMSAWKEIINTLKGDSASVLVQEMVRGGRELMAGLIRDAQFGPCVMFGLGGIYTEALRDVSLRVAPLTKAEALDMIGEIKGRNMLGAVRGMPAADVDALADILVTLGTIGLGLSEIKEIDINPIILSGSRPVAVDALIVLA